MIVRRHPSPVELGAFFDGEPVEGVGPHLARCRRCRESLDELGAVRAVVRGELDLTDGSARRRGRWTVALIPVAAAVALLLALANPPGGLPVTRVQNDQTAAPAAQPEAASTRALDGVNGATTGPAAAADAGRPRTASTSTPAPGQKAGSLPAAARAGNPETSPASPGPGAVPVAGADAVTSSGGRPAGSAASSTGAAPAATPASGVLHLGVPVPTRGPSSGEGAEVLRAVKAVIDRASAAGGVAGRPVELVPVPIDDERARADALGRVDALVGGFAFPAPAGMVWIMPADVAPGGSGGPDGPGGPDASGPDVAASELAAEDAGAALGADLAARGFSGRTVGAIVAAGPDAGLAAGLGRTLPVQQVEAGGDTSCEQEVVALRKRDVAALALAGPPDMARRCAGVAARMGWRPPGGLLLAPSAVYAHLERELVAQGARSAVALSVPGGDDAGTNRFRQWAPGCESYRALVSFAAAELALGVARSSNGVLSAGAVRDGHWRSDLYDVEGGRHTTSHVVSVRFGRWVNVPPPRGSQPPARHGVTNPFGTVIALSPEDS